MAGKAIRPIRVEGNVAYVPLTQGYEAVIDADDAPLVEGFNWTANVARRTDGLVRTIYAARKIKTSGKCRLLYMHQLMCRVPQGMEVDHVDGDGLNNRRSNLRGATKAQNAHNQRISAANTSGAKGVTWHKRDRRWMAQIHLGGKNHYLGSYNTAEDAHKAYAEASLALHGDYGRAK